MVFINSALQMYRIKYNVWKKITVNNVTDYSVELLYDLQFFNYILFSAIFFFFIKTAKVE
jgi:hypothetical protein